MSMKLLLANSIEHAEVLDALAMAYLHDTQGANGTEWSGVFIDWQGGVPRYAILWDDCLLGLFTWEEVEASVIEGDWLVRDEQGQFVSGNWERLVPENETASSL